MFQIKFLVFCIFFIFTNVSFSIASNIESKYYENLSKEWLTIFPDGNRNAAGPKFFKYISDKYKNYSEFEEYSKLYCAVSGSLISPNSKPEFVNIKEDHTSKNVCGYYYKCCWPCVCDLMKYAKVIKITRDFAEGPRDIFVLVIDNPCSKKDFPKEVNKSYFCKGDIIDEKQVATKKNKMIIGILHKAKYCQPSDLRKIYSNNITGKLCSIRNRKPISQIRSGMGDIFIKLAK